MRINVLSIVSNFDSYVAKVLNGVLFINFALAIALGLLFDSLSVAFILGLLLVSGPLILQFLKPYSSLAQSAMAFAYMSFVTLHVHLSHGMIEMHFGYFVLLAILFAYLRITPILVAAGAGAVYHVLFAAMQASGTPVYLFNDGNLLVTSAGIPVFILVHAAYLVVETVVLLFMAVITRPIVDTAQIIINSNTAMLKDNGDIDLSVPIDDSGNELVARYKELIGAVRESISHAVETTQVLSRSLSVLQETYASVSERVGDQDSKLESISHSSSQVTEAAYSLSEIAVFLKDKSVDLLELKNQSVHTVQESADKTGHTSELMTSTNDSLAKVDSDSVAISSMVEAIQGIAEQTNLLALNAAIEAARAGEQGRGFAVVADEVRALATRTHQATEDIKTIISNLTEGASQSVRTMTESVEEIRSSQELNVTAVEQMNTLGGEIDDINNSTLTIASAVEQQTQVSETIAKEVKDIADSSRQMAKSIDEGNEYLSEVATRFEALNASIRKFNT